MEIPKCLFHFLPQMPVEVGERFIEQHDVRLGDEAAGKRNTLPLATGKFGGTAIREALKSDGGKRLTHPLPVFFARNTAHLQRVAGIVGNRHVRPQRIGLEHHCHVAPLRRHHAAGIGQHPLAKQDGTIVHGRFRTGTEALRQAVKDQFRQGTTPFGR